MIFYKTSQRKVSTCVLFGHPLALTCVDFGSTHSIYARRRKSFTVWPPKASQQYTSWSHVNCTCVESICNLRELASRLAHPVWLTCVDLRVRHTYDASIAYARAHAQEKEKVRVNRGDASTSVRRRKAFLFLMLPLARSTGPFSCAYGLCLLLCLCLRCTCEPVFRPRKKWNKEKIHLWLT